MQASAPPVRIRGSFRISHDEQHPPVRCGQALVGVSTTGEGRLVSTCGVDDFVITLFQENSQE
jgi:hypothetical protein